jgi:hypothetical protein
LKSTLDGIYVYWKFERLANAASEGTTTKCDIRLPRPTDIATVSA